MNTLHPLSKLKRRSTALWRLNYGCRCWCYATMVVREVPVSCLCSVGFYSYSIFSGWTLRLRLTRWWRVACCDVVTSGVGLKAINPKVYTQPLNTLQTYYTRASGVGLQTIHPKVYTQPLNILQTDYSRATKHRKLSPQKRFDLGDQPSWVFKSSISFPYNERKNSNYFLLVF